VRYEIEVGLEEDIRDYDRVGIMELARWSLSSENG
jgi:hypothetical protein